MKQGNYNVSASGGGGSLFCQVNVSASAGVDLMSASDCKSNETIMFV